MRDLLSKQNSQGIGVEAKKELKVGSVWASSRSWNFRFSAVPNLFSNPALASSLLYPEPWLVLNQMNSYFRVAAPTAVALKRRNLMRQGLSKKLAVFAAVMTHFSHWMGMGGNREL